MPRIHITFHGHVIESPQLTKSEATAQAKTLETAMSSTDENAVAHLPWGMFRARSLDHFHVDADSEQ